MNRKKASALIVAIIVALVAAGSVSAMDSVAPDSAIIKYFEERGVSAAALQAPKEALSSAEWNKLADILDEEDDTDDDYDDHDMLNTLVAQALYAAGAENDSPMMMQIGNTQWVIGLPYEEEDE